jgi:hypothetical protein
MRHRRHLRRLPLARAAAAATALLLLGATPAAAHVIGGGVAPSNYRTRILAVSPPLPGLTVRVLEASGTLQLVNRSGVEVVVLGARLEPYLRVGAHGGVEENRRSPTWLANRPTRAPSATVPLPPGSGIPPLWHRVAAGVTVTWHDHRAHWTGPAPAQVRQAPGRQQVVIPRWTVPLHAGGTTVLVTGDVTWVPGPSPWPWAAVAVLLVVLAPAVGRGRMRGPALAALLGVAVAADVVHTVGSVLASTAPLGARLLGSSSSVLGWLLAGSAVQRLLWRPRSDSGPVLLLAAGLFIGIIAAGDLLALTRSQIPSALPPALARATVAVAVGLGGGMVLAGLDASRVQRAATPADPDAALDQDDGGWVDHAEA